MFVLCISIYILWALPTLDAPEDEDEDEDLVLAVMTQDCRLPPLCLRLPLVAVTQRLIRAILFTFRRGHGTGKEQHRVRKGSGVKAQDG